VESRDHEKFPNIAAIFTDPQLCCSRHGIYWTVSIHVIMSLVDILQSAAVGCHINHLKYRFLVYNKLSNIIGVDDSFSLLYSSENKCSD